jgi:HAD superfamily hydrolase (TIGR01509 family)
MNKKLTLLDLGGVVFQSTGKSNERIKWETITLLNGKYGNELNVGKDLFYNFLKEYNEITNQKLSKEGFLKAVFDTLEINSELIEIVRAESDIVIVSDNYRENIAYISERYNFKSWSIGEIYSFDYELEKSNPNFFKRLLKELKEYDKEQLLFIDDSPNKIKSATENGIEGILFENNEQVRKDLKKYFH